MSEQWITVEAEPFSEQVIAVEPEFIESVIDVIQEPIGLTPVDIYVGAYEFTPSEDTQTISIADQMASQNITINPIPSNYGRIEWNGSTLMVY